MKMLNTLRYIYLLLGISVMLYACKGPDKTAVDDDAKVESQTPVTITTINDNSMVDYTDLNATSAFLQKNYVKANANGYIQIVNVQLGQFVKKGQLIFIIETKEAKSIGNSINVLDTTFKFSGMNKIKAPEHGYITQLSHQTGDYVQDGEQLAVISDRSSFAFVMQLPYEIRSSVKNNQDVQLTLPDGRKLDGKVTTFMPGVDTMAQTQGIVVRVNSTTPIPENLVAKARIVRASKQNTISLPKSAILTDETQTDYWVMKLINATTAVRVNITKGITVGDRVEILSPKFSPQDKIVVSGNYGLTDTANVKVLNP
jgi:multidrug efflux pump subunit AcrA (membrane-fusion protein)